MNAVEGCSWLPSSQDTFEQGLKQLHPSVFDAQLYKNIVSSSNRCASSTSLRKNQRYNKCLEQMYNEIWLEIKDIMEEEKRLGLDVDSASLGYEQFEQSVVKTSTQQNQQHQPEIDDLLTLYDRLKQRSIHKLNSSSSSVAIVSPAKKTTNAQNRGVSCKMASRHVNKTGESKIGKANVEKEECHVGRHLRSRKVESQQSSDVSLFVQVGESCGGRKNGNHQRKNGKMKHQVENNCNRRETVENNNLNDQHANRVDWSEGKACKDNKCFVCTKVGTDRSDVNDVICSKMPSTSTQKFDNNFSVPEKRYIRQQSTSNINKFISSAAVKGGRSERQAINSVVDESLGRNNDIGDNREVTIDAGSQNTIQIDESSGNLFVQTKQLKNYKKTVNRTTKGAKAKTILKNSRGKKSVFGSHKVGKSRYVDSGVKNCRQQSVTKENNTDNVSVELVGNAQCFPSKFCRKATNLRDSCNRQCKVQVKFADVQSSKPSRSVGLSVFKTPNLDNAHNIVTPCLPCNHKLFVRIEAPKIIGKSLLDIETEMKRFHGLLKSPQTTKAPKTVDESVLEIENQMELFCGDSKSPQISEDPKIVEKSRLDIEKDLKNPSEQPPQIISVSSCRNDIDAVSIQAVASNSKNLIASVNEQEEKEVLMTSGMERNSENFKTPVQNLVMNNKCLLSDACSLKSMALKSGAKHPLSRSKRIEKFHISQKPNSIQNHDEGDKMNDIICQLVLSKRVKMYGLLVDIRPSLQSGDRRIAIIWQCDVCNRFYTFKELSDEFPTKTLTALCPKQCRQGNGSKHIKGQFLFEFVMEDREGSYHTYLLAGKQAESFFGFSAHSFWSSDDARQKVGKSIERLLRSYQRRIFSDFFVTSANLFGDQRKYLVNVTRATEERISS